MLRATTVVLLTFVTGAAAAARPDRAPSIDPIIAALAVNLADDAPLTPTQRDIAHRAGSRLVSLCPDCRLSTIDEEGPCGWARTNRHVIQRAVAAGLSEDAIVERYVATYGPDVLAVDTNAGKYRVMWAAPYLLVLAGLGLVFVVGRRARRRKETEPEPDVSVEPTDRALLDAELDALDR